MSLRRPRALLTELRARAFAALWRGAARLAVRADVGDCSGHAARPNFELEVSRALVIGAWPRSRYLPIRVGGLFVPGMALACVGGAGAVSGFELALSSREDGLTWPRGGGWWEVAGASLLA